MKKLKERKKWKKYNVSPIRIRDLYANLCPSIYHKKQIKLLDMSKRENQLPGYTKYESFNAMRTIPLPEDPFPTEPDFFNI